MKKVVKVAVCLLSASSLFLVGCNGNGSSSVASSSSSSLTYTLAKVTGIKYDRDTHKISWNAVTDASSYEIVIGNEAAVTVETTSYDYQAGDQNSFAVKVTAISESHNGIRSETTTTQIHYLKPPSKSQLRYTYGTVSWDPIAGATSYLVYINDVQQGDAVTTTSYTIASSLSDFKINIYPQGTSTETDFYYSQKSEANSYHLVGRPAAAFEKSSLNIHWTAVSGSAGYYLQIVLNNQVAYEHTFGSSGSATSDFQFADAGLYTVNLAAKGDSAAGSSDSGYTSFTVRRLASPSDIAVAEGDNSFDVTFDGVSNASSYKVAVDGVATGETQTTTYTYPISGSATEEESHTFAVSSHSNDNYVLDSLDAANIQVTKLGTPKNIRLENGRILWDPVNKAVSYDVVFDGVASNVSTTEYLLSQLGEGSHKIAVRAVGNHSTIIRSSYTSQTTITKLKAPTNLVVSDSHTLSWDTVTGCTGYEVDLDNGASKYDATGASFTIPAIAASTTLTVIAKGDGGFVMDSDPSVPLSLYALSAPINLSVKDGNLVWNSVTNASSYELSIQDKIETPTGTSFTMDAYAAGTYTIKVKAIGKGASFSSDYSQPITVTKLPNVTGIAFDASKGISWNKVIEATGYSLFIDGGTPIVLASNVLSYKPDFKTSGTHTVSIRALGNDTSNLVPSTPVIATTTASALAIPSNVALSRTSTGFKVTATLDANASGLAVSFSGKVITSTTNEVSINTSTPGSYDIYCYALGDGTVYVNSERTTTTSAVILSAPSNLRMSLADTNLYIASWDAVSNATKYKVTVAKYTSATEFTTGDYSISVAKINIDTTGLVKVIVTVVAQADDAMTLDSEGTVLTKSFN